MHERLTNDWHLMSFSVKAVMILIILLSCAFMKWWEWLGNNQRPNKWSDWKRRRR